jgi:hypothetical protein
MKKFKSCKGKSFKGEGKVFGVSLLLSWLGLALLCDELNPVSWPSVCKPMLLIVAIVFFVFISNNKVHECDHYTKKEKEKNPE